MIGAHRQLTCYPSSEAHQCDLSHAVVPAAPGNRIKAEASAVEAQHWALGLPPKGEAKAPGAPMKGRKAAARVKNGALAVAKKI